MDIGLRIDIQPDFKYQDFLTWCKAALEPAEMVISQETSKQAQKEHLHLYVKTTHPLLNKFSTWRKKLNKDLRELFNLHKHNKSIFQVEDRKKYLVYIIKDGDILHNDLEEEEYEELEEETNKINKDKNTKQYIKVYEHLKHKNIRTTREYINAIHDLYINEFNQAPPARHIIINSLQYYFYQTKDLDNLTRLLGLPDLEMCQTKEESIEPPKPDQTKPIHDIEWYERKATARQLKKKLLQEKQRKKLLK